MRARWLLAILYPLGLIAGHITPAQAAIGRWCGSGPGTPIPAHHDPDSVACHAILNCERKRAGRRGGG